MEENRKHLDELEAIFQKWLHIEDRTFLNTLCAMKVSHKIPGDPLWLMAIGASSSGKSEYLRAFTQENEIVIDDLTTKTFVSGTHEKLAEVDHLAARLANNLWYIYDLSIMMSKRSDDRSQILSDMRMIYDGKIIKEFGTRKRVEIPTPHNTLICGTTPVVDNTILEDQLLGTRFLMYRLPLMNRSMTMQKIDDNENDMVIMRDELNFAIKIWEQKVEVRPVELSHVDNNNLQLMCNITTLLRTAGSFDRRGELNNIIYPEETPRFYKQIKKLYKSYRIIGLTEDESIRCIRKVCVNNINPIRIRLLEWMKNNDKMDEIGRSRTFTTTEIHSGTGLGKKTIKSHLYVLNHLGLVSFRVSEEGLYSKEKDNWRLLDSNLNLLLDKKKIRIGCNLSKLKYIKTQPVSGDGSSPKDGWVG